MKMVFELAEGQTVNWAADKQFSESDLRSRIEPWLTSLFQSEHLSLLAGSGLTSAVQGCCIYKADNGMGVFEPKSFYHDQITQKATESAIRMGRDSKPNIEDYIRVQNELLRGLEIVGGRPQI